MRSRPITPSGTLRGQTLATWRSVVLWVLTIGIALAQPPTFRYFYDDAGQLFRVLDSTGTLIEYDYDLTGNIVQIQRSTVAPTSLTIFNVAPLSGPVGQNVTIYGQNFSASAAGDVVQIGGVNATVVSASSTVLVVQIPTGITSGTITVAVNGTTVNAGALTFIPPPSITSISPNTGDAGQPVTVTIQGLNLSGATFSLGAGGMVATVSTNDTTAMATITPGSKLGLYTLVATSPAGALSSTAASDANTFLVYYPPGANSAVSSFTVFNSMGTFLPAGANETDQSFTVFNALTSPGSHVTVPAGSNEADQKFTVFNSFETAGETVTLPAGSNEADQKFTVFNSLLNPGTDQALPAGGNEADQNFTVFNALLSPGTSPVVPQGHNEAWQLFTTQNSQSGGSQGPMTVPVGQTDGGSSPEISLFAGQTVQIAVRPSQFFPFLELDAGSAPFATSLAGSLSVPFTAPASMSSVTLRGLGRTESGERAESLDLPIRIAADPGRTITGRAVDDRGSPIAGAAVTWEAKGWLAEWYRADGAAADSIPEIRGVPARMSFISALNYPNPQQVFGPDPMGVGIAGGYVGRFSGEIRVATPGPYKFDLLAHRAARLIVDGRTVAEAVAAGDEAVAAAGTVNLTAGAHRIQVNHFESGGAASIQLFWTPPGGAQEVVPPSAISAEAPASWRVRTDSDGKFELHVPAALDGVKVKLVSSTGSVEVDQ